MPISKERLQQAMQDWKPVLAEQLAQDKIKKKKLTNKSKINAAKKKAQKSASNMLKSIDRGMRF